MCTDTKLRYMLLIVCLDRHLFRRLLSVRTNDTSAVRKCGGMVQNWKANSQLNIHHMPLCLTVVPQTKIRERSRSTFRIARYSSPLLQVQYTS